MNGGISIQGHMNAPLSLRSKEYFHATKGNAVGEQPAILCVDIRAE